MNTPSQHKEGGEDLMVPAWNAVTLYNFPRDAVGLKR